MKENKKAILEILKKKSQKDGKFENLVLNLALQKIDSDNFEFDGEAVYTADKKRLVYYMNHDASFTIPEGWSHVPHILLSRTHNPGIWISSFVT